MSELEPNPALARGLSDTAWLVLGSLLGALLGLVALRLLLSALSEEDYGRYSMFVTAAGLLAVFVSWPTAAALRLGSEEVAERGSLGRTAGSTFSLLLLAALLVGGAAFLGRAPLDAFVGHPGAWRYVVAFAALSGLANLGYTLLLPAGKVSFRTLIPSLSRAFQAGLLALIVLRSVISIEQVFHLWTIAALPAVLGALLLVRAQIGRPGVSREYVVRALDFGWPLLLRNLGIMGLVYVDVIALRVLTGDLEQVGRYQVAYQIAEQVVVFGFVMEFLAAPILASAAANKRPETLQRFYRLAAPAMLWSWSLGAALLVVLAEPLLIVLGAKSAAASAGVLKLLLIAVAIRGAAAVEDAVFSAHLLSRWPTAFFFVALALNVVLDVVLIRGGFGLAGPALATVLAFALQALLRGIYLRKAFGVPALRPYFGVLPVPLMLIAAFLIPWWPVQLAVWLVLAVAVLAIGKRAGLFPPEAREILAQVRMPAALRSCLDWIYG